MNAQNGSKTIFVVDDDPLFRTFIREVLEESGYLVLEAGNGEEALKLYERDHPSIDLLFTDIVMPFMDGVELAERLSKLLPSVKIVFTSGYSTLPRPSQCETTGADGNFVEKPCDPNQLLQTIRKLLDS
jgi:CheY-like chemotaxis protein